ncbi:hypothetical protein BCY91_03330 [Pelobium manganitolerans]|uniref:Uncharacterized protein n=1 Tax=Pelobium manganitolerans TaxID=1842495 RepID=A0A419S775_9SPHI|nr:hypothetical protein [Pelobium manganitolerans]RKD17185.1 hypothetical protein BCY91_03330 [Pelobium manganitolerans]
MKKLNRKSIIILVSLIIIGAMLYNSLSQPGIDSLKTDFKQISFTRNEQNDGPVLRAYVVTVDTLILSELETYGNFMPHTKYGNTKVYFFNKNAAYPSSVKLAKPVFDERYLKNCLAVYEKDGMGNVSLNQSSSAMR